MIYGLHVFSPILWLCFHFLIVSLNVQRFLVLMKLYLLLIHLFLDACALGVISKKSLPNPRLQRLIPTFSTKVLYF